MSHGDYRDIIGRVLADAAGNGYRLAATARATQAALFCEAAKACAQAHQSGVPLVLQGADDTEEFNFGIGLLFPSLKTPHFHFERQGTHVVITARNLAAAALDGHEARFDFVPGELPPEDLAGEIRHRVELATELLVQHVALARKPG